MRDTWDHADCSALVVVAREWMRPRGDLAWEGDPGLGPIASLLGILERTPRLSPAPSVWAMLQGAAAGIRHAWAEADEAILDAECERDNAEEALELQQRATSVAEARATRLEVELQKLRKKHGCAQTPSSP